MQIRGIRGKKNVVGKITFPYIILTIIAFLLCLRCFYSFCWSDESFYLSLVHRFWLGDRPIIDELSGIQFYSLVLLPIYGFYMKIIGNNEGIYLFFRLLIVISNYFLSIYIYKSLKGSTHEIPALIGALIYLLYTRANILGASYYSVALLFFTWTVFLLFNYNRNETNNIRMFTIGCTMAVTVLSLPYLAVVYILTIGFVVCLSPFQRYRKCLLVTIMGTGFCAIIYLGFLSTRISLSELTMFIPYLFEDVEHQSMNPVLSIVVWFGRIVNRYKYTIAISIISILYLCLKKIQHKTIEWKSTKIIIIINLMLTVVNILFSYNVIGCSNIAIAIFSIICFLGVESNDMISKKIFKEVYFPGVVFSIIFHMASNTGLDAITIGFVLCGIASPVIVFESVSNITWGVGKTKKWICCGVAVAAALVLLQSGWLRFFSVYRDDKLVNLTDRIEQGPAKYLYTTQEHKEQYDDVVMTIKKTLDADAKGTVVFTEMVPWAYLCISNSYGSPSPCRFWGGLNKVRLEMYYNNMPDKFPEYVMAVTPEYGSCKSVLIQGDEIIERPNERGTSQWLINELEGLEYDKLKSSCGIIYKKR